MVRGEIPRAITKILSRDVTMFVSRCGQTLTRPTKHDLDKPPSGGGGEWGGRGGPCVHPHSLEGGKHGSEWRLMCNFVTPTPIAKPKPRSVHQSRYSCDPLPLPQARKDIRSLQLPIKRQMIGRTSLYQSLKTLDQNHDSLVDLPCFSSISRTTT